MKKSLLAAALIGIFTCVPTFAEAGGKTAPHGSSASKPSKDEAKTALPSNPKFVEYQSGFTWTMRIEGLGKRGDTDGYIQYDKYDFEKAKIVSNVSAYGIVGVPGVGEALKKHLLEVYKDATFESDLIKTNRDRLLGLWSKSYPSAPSSDELREAVPALATKFGNDFDFEIKAFPSKSGGSIHLWVKPNGSGTASVLNPEAMDQLVLSDPKYKPASAKKEEEAKKEEAKKEAEAKKEEAKKEAEAKKEEAKKEAEAKKEDRETDKKGKDGKDGKPKKK